MRSFISNVLIIITIVLTAIGCDVFSSDEGGVVTLTGTVVNSLTRVGIEGVIVQIPASGALEETDAQGRYTISTEVDSAQIVTIEFQKSGFASTFIQVLGEPDITKDVDPVLLDPEVGTIDPEDPGARVSGRASNILLESQSATSIGVKESGSEEVAELIFLVTDSLGRPITLENQVTVNFSFGVDPGGGAFIAPESAQTDGNGRVRTNISSGIVSGVLQVVAEAAVDDRTIRSKPVALAIHGGLPDEEHFGVAPSVLNVARAWDIWGTEAGITAFVGDQYGNPVRVGTSVSFTTSAGIIGGSSTTGADGRAPVTIISGPPQPDHPEFGRGYVTIIASTADINQNEITDDALILFSGSSNIVVPAGQGAIELGKPYEFFVYDQNQNPLASGTNITVVAEGTNVEAFGNTNVFLTDKLFGDHNFEDQGITYGTTRFTFGVRQGEGVDDQGMLLPPIIEAVTIRVTSPNGNIERVVVQAGGVFKRDAFGELVPVLD